MNTSKPIDHVKISRKFIADEDHIKFHDKRLWSMRTRLLGLGLSQVLGSIAAIALAGWALGADPKVAIIAGMALALSSTALALQPLTERGVLGTQGGQGTFAMVEDAGGEEPLGLTAGVGADGKLTAQAVKEEGDAPPEPGAVAGPAEDGEPGLNRAVIGGALAIAAFAVGVFIYLRRQDKPLPE